MRLTRFGEYCTMKVGIAVGDDIVDVATLGLPPDPVALLGGTPDDWEAALRGARDSDARRPVSDVRLWSPLPRPSKSIGVGLNMRQAFSAVHQVRR